MITYTNNIWNHAIVVKMIFDLNLITVYYRVNIKDSNNTKWSYPTDFLVQKSILFLIHYLNKFFSYHKLFNEPWIL